MFSILLDSLACFNTFILINHQTYCCHRPSHNHHHHYLKDQIHLLHLLHVDCFGTLSRNTLQYTSIQNVSKSIFVPYIQFCICTAQFLKGTPELMDGSIHNIYNCSSDPNCPSITHSRWKL